MSDKDFNGTTTFVRISSELEGVEIVDVLNEAGIPARYISQQVSMYDDVFVGAQGFWGEVLVPPQLHERAREVLKREFSGRADYGGAT